MQEKEPRISVRVSPEIKAALDEVEKQTGIKQANLIRACIEALINYVKEHHEITCPLIVKPKSAEAIYYPKHRDEISTFEEKTKPSLKKKPAA